MTQQLTDGSLELAPRNDRIHYSVLEEKLGGLESFGQLLADGLLDHARSREADHRARLGQNGIAEHREAGANTTGSGIGEDRDVGNSALRELRQDRSGLGHLHEREHPFLHASATGSGDDDEGIFPLDGALPETGELLTDDGSHRATHEGEVHDRKADGHSTQLSGEGEYR